MASTSSADSRPVERMAFSRSNVTDRLFFIDNIRILLIILVNYAGSGSWIYNKHHQDDIRAMIGRWFCSVNHSKIRKIQYVDRIL